MKRVLHSAVAAAGTNAKFEAVVLPLSADDDVKCNYMLNPA